MYPSSAEQLTVLLPWLPFALWCAWWLWCVNWKHAWPVLAHGAWVPVALLVLVAALAWSRIAPSAISLGLFTLPNFWWQLLAVTALVLVALLCGFIQGKLGWTPAEVDFHPASTDHDHH
jgi:hypothetical protein